jgi:transposase
VVISVTLFDSIRHWHDQGMSRREIARRLNVDVKTVRRQLHKIAGGATAPQRSSPGSKLDPYRERIGQLVEDGRSAWSIFQDLCADPAFSASYELVKKYVARIRVRDPKVYERLEHLPGAEVQADFGELVRVRHQGKTVRTWAYVAVWPHSGYRYAEVVLDQTVPTFLRCVQNGTRESGAIPERLSIDNLGSGVFRDRFAERAYQKEFAALCAHYGMMPNAVRPRTPTDKGTVERGVSALKAFLRGRVFDTVDDLRMAVAAWARTSNERPHSVTGRRPNDLIAAERRHMLPDVYPIAHWKEHRVRSDCHVQVQRNFYSVPYSLVGKVVVVRLDATVVMVYYDFNVVARHERRVGRGETVTDRTHYPPHKQRATQEIHRDRIDRVRAVGPGAAEFLRGLLQSRSHVHSDAYRALLRLIASTDPAVLDRACARAAHFGNYSLDALRTIIAKRLYELPLDDLTIRPSATPAFAVIRPLQAYAELLGTIAC